MANRLPERYLEWCENQVAGETGPEAAVLIRFYLAAPATLERAERLLQALAAVLAQPAA